MKRFGVVEEQVSDHSKFQQFENTVEPSRSVEEEPCTEITVL